MAHYSISVANYILDKARESKNTLTPMQILKLVYLSHGWMLGLYHRPLIKEPVEAWRYGPVIPELYQAVKKFGSKPVEKLPEYVREEFDNEEKDVMGQTLEVYGSLSGLQLSSLTHLKGTPWHKTWTSHAWYSAEISNDLIEDYYSELADQDGPS